MLEDRKIAEIRHYDEDAKNWRGGSFDVQGVNVMMMESYRYIYEILRREVPEKTVLDYGCGHGMHAVPITRFGGKVTGVDLSEESLKIAKQRATKEDLGDKIKLVVGDCEALPFADQSFDIVFDGGTFSSLDIEKAFSEIARVLKPGGLLIGIETLGHNPLANFKRWINKKRGIRTGWAADHIMKISDIKSAQKYFNVRDTNFFHFFSMFAFPFRNLPGGKIIFRILDKIDNFILKIPLLKRYAFKVVFIFSVGKNKGEK